VVLLLTSSARTNQFSCCAHEEFEKGKKPGKTSRIQKQLSGREFKSETWKGHGCNPDGFKGVHLGITGGGKSTS